MIGVADCVRIEEAGLGYCLERKTEALLVAVREEEILSKEKVENPKLPTEMKTTARPRHLPS